MSSYRKHVAHILLGLFLAPQVNNALHYFWIEHHFASVPSQKTVVSKTHSGHHCDTSIFDLPLITATDAIVFNPLGPLIPHNSYNGYKQLYLDKIKCIQRLRGPPAPVSIRPNYLNTNK